MTNVTLHVLDQQTRIVAAAFDRPAEQSLRVPWVRAEKALMSLDTLSVQTLPDWAREPLKSRIRTSVKQYNM